MQRLLFAELLRKRCAGDHARYVEAFRRAAVDPNPHQVEAVAFALSRLDEGGALLCDEVGLGKTIETGLLLSQMKTNNQANVLIIVPVPLARQWQVELKDLFSLDSRVVGSAGIPDSLDRGIVIAGREFVGSPKWYETVKSWGPWDLVVIDEAHEIMSSIHTRFNMRTGEYETNLKKGKSRRAAFIKDVIGDAPAVLLTATPLQNSLFELWALVHFVDPGCVALGRIHEFAGLFCTAGGKGVKPEAEDELRRRLKGVVCRTLRSEAQPFLSTPFTARHCETINFHMEAAERELYAGVSDWLGRGMSLYKPQHQRLMQLNLRRRMGSSVPALATTLKKMRDRLEGNDPDDFWEPPESVTEARIEADIREVIRLHEVAERLAQKGGSPKLDGLWNFIKKISDQRFEKVVSNKIVIFTESRVTLKSIVEYLEGKGLQGQVTAFSGTNDSLAAQAALRCWEEEVGCFLEPCNKPERGSALRAALIHEFKTRTRVLVATESGAKGLNLQFCNCLVNFDLPWNPQRIEQRIGRVHRYGQLHDVVIVNFINLDNEGEERVYNILKDKLQLFEGLLGASDPVLGLTASALGFEDRVLDLLSRCRTPEARKKEFDRLEKELDDQARALRDKKLQHARGLISSLDANVQDRLRQTSDALPLALSRRDETILEILDSESPVERLGVKSERLLFRWNGRKYHVGQPLPGLELGEPLLVDHPALEALLARCQAQADGGNFRLRGEPAIWCVYLLKIDGLERSEQLLVLGPGGKAGLLEALEGELDVLEESWADDPQLAQALEDIQTEVEERQHPLWHRRVQQLNARREDGKRYLDQQEALLVTALEKAARKKRAARTPADTRTAQGQVTRLENELHILRAERSQKLAESRRLIDEKLNALIPRRYVQVSERRLFRVERR
jgi:hypothetical protein